MTPQKDQITMYSTSWCPDCHRAKYFFDNYGIDYTNIDIEEQPEAAAIVRQINNGNQSVPTIVFADGSVLVEPSNRQLAEKTDIEL